MIRPLCILLLSSLIISCEKESYKCPGNCADLIIAGRVIDTSNNKGLANIPIIVYWVDAGICYICPHSDVKTTLSDRDGSFHLVVSIDTTKFHGNSLNVEIPVPNGFVSYSRYGPDHLTYSLLYYDPSALTNLRFVVYQKTNLTINLQRALSDTFTRFDLDYYYSSTHNGLYTYDGLPPVPITSFNVETAANLFTKVNWKKGYGFGQSKSFTDSIQCTKTGNNSLVLNY